MLLTQFHESPPSEPEIAPAGKASSNQIVGLTGVKPVAVGVLVPALPVVALLELPVVPVLPLLEPPEP